jgi:catechol 2,3-dioxygenase-like lactoylglutathione lyase family enzyme
MRNSCTAAIVCVVVLSGVTRADDKKVAAVESVGIVVADLDRAVRFYVNVLHFERRDQAEATDDAFDRSQSPADTRIRTAVLRLGDETLELIEFLSPGGRAVPEDSRSNDHWFQHIAIIVRDMDAAYAQLRRHKVRHVSEGPQTLPVWNKGAAGIRAFYFLDPDGHVLEVLQFPLDKGNAKWQRDRDRLFLGIDHTAIVVSDTDASLAFYRDRLGMRVVGEGENYGPEQERLNGVFPARVRITTLAAEAGPRIELLEYLAPSNGRRKPAETRFNDLIQWQTRLCVTPRAAAASKTRAEFIADPDGHLLRIAP